jgi:hypothetical protein
MGGYDSRHTGSITITPPLTWAQTKSEVLQNLRDLKLFTEETRTETETGITAVITAAAIVPAYSYPYNGYDIREELQSAINAFPDHQFAGTITAQPEDPDGMPWQYTIRDRTVIRQTARYEWVD